MPESSIQEIIDFIKPISLFSNLDPSSLQKIAEEAVEVEYESSQKILNEGDFADALYIIKNGDVRIYTINLEHKKIILGRFQKGECFGEHSLSPTQSPRRTASAEAVYKSTLYKIPRNALLQYVSFQKETSIILKKKLQDYVNDKLTKLTKSLGVPLELSKLLNKTKSFEDREVIYYQGNAAEEVYILTFGSVELRHFDENLSIDRCTQLGVGEIFGAFPLEENQKNYQNTAIATSRVQVAAIPIAILQDCIKNVSNFFGTIQKLENRHKFSQYGPTIQFRGEYKNLPTFATLIALKDGREVISQQFINHSLTYISLSETKPDQSFDYNVGDFKREIQLEKNRLVGLYELGSWDDTDQMLELIVNQNILSDNDLENFKQTGHFKIGVKAEKSKEYVCQCMRVTKEDIDKAIQSGRCTVEEIKNTTGASSVCGGCYPTIVELLGGNAWVPCRLEVTAKHTPHIHTFRFTPLKQIPVNYSPGQHIVVRANINDMWISRSYTLTSHPNKDFFEITVKLEENGMFSPWLFGNSSKNPVIYASGPYGEFTLNKNAPSIVCFAGGIGITPFISFSRYLVQIPSSQSLHIDYSARNDSDHVFKEEFEKSIKALKNSSINFRVTSKHGKISSSDVLEPLKNHPDSDVYICGPSNFENFIKQTLKEAGILDSRIHVEQFIQAGNPEFKTELISL